MDVMDFIKEQVATHPVVIFMKGTPDFPQCGFSARAAEALRACSEELAYVNIFEDPEIHRNLPRFSNWPTFPQVFIGGELIGGCDITLELYERGELQKMVRAAVEQAGSR
ncbi:MAG TPA: Grx4 family monothiol glutaredoxin [Gammaproteobacteria bacterium]|nr:Grx4 family monothiol glutaredoxin [Gammaproteobacteria bacterium]